MSCKKFNELNISKKIATLLKCFEENDILFNEICFHDELDFILSKTAYFSLNRLFYLKLLILFTNVSMKKKSIRKFNLSNLELDIELNKEFSYRVNIYTLTEIVRLFPHLNSFLRKKSKCINEFLFLNSKDLISVFLSNNNLTNSLKKESSFLINCSDYKYIKDQIKECCVCLEESKIITRCGHSLCLVCIIYILKSKIDCNCKLKLPCFEHRYEIYIPNIFNCPMCREFLYSY